MQNTITAGPLARRLAAAALALAAAAGLAMAMAGQALAVTAGGYTDDVISTEGKVVYTLPDPADFRDLLSADEQDAVLDEAVGADVLAWTVRESGATVRVQGKWHSQLRGGRLTLDELDYVYVDCAGGTSALLSPAGDDYWGRMSPIGLNDFFDGDDYSLDTESHKRQGYLVLGSRITSLDDGWKQLYEHMYTDYGRSLNCLAYVQAIVFEAPSSCSFVGAAVGAGCEEDASAVKREGVTLSLPGSVKSVSADAFRGAGLARADVSVPAGVDVPASAWYSSPDTAAAAEAAVNAYKKAHGKVTVKVKKKRIKKGKYVYKVAFPRIEGAAEAPSLHIWRGSNKSRIVRNVKAKGLKVVLKKNAPRGKYTCRVNLYSGVGFCECVLKITFKVV